MTKILYLFPDTNLLVQCRPLEELDWEQWKQFDEIHLIISRPVFISRSLTLRSSIRRRAKWSSPKCALHCHQSQRTVGR